MFQSKLALLEKGRALLSEGRFSSKVLREQGVNVSDDGSRRTAAEVLQIPAVEFSSVVNLVPALSELPVDVQEQLHRDAIYATYIERQAQDVVSLRRDEGMFIPSDFDFLGLNGVSNEVRQKLDRQKPETVAQAAKIEGMTPAALTVIVARLRAFARKVS